MNIEAIEQFFHENFEKRGELGAGLSLWEKGEEVLNLAGGFTNRSKASPWTVATIAPIYSATKAPAAATLLQALEEKGLGEDDFVSEIWPAFPIDSATFGEMLSHQCGLAALAEKVSVFDHAAVVAAIENTSPEWTPGVAHGYHPRTYGFLLDECVRRLTGEKLGERWNRLFADALEIDLWIGLPEKEWPRVAELVPGRAKPGAFEEGFYAAFNTPNSVTRRAFSSPTGLNAISEMNDPKAWTASLPAMGGVASSRGIAKFYQCAIGAIESPLSKKVQQDLAILQISGEDRVLLRETAFTAGCQKDPVDENGEKIRQLYGSSLSAFGHPGAGGSHGFADPERSFSFGYVMNQMELSVMPGERCQGLVKLSSH